MKPTEVVQDHTVLPGPVQNVRDGTEGLTNMKEKIPCHAMDAFKLFLQSTDTETVTGKIGKTSICVFRIRAKTPHVVV